jgi:hypothetical protein
MEQKRQQGTTELTPLSLKDFNDQLECGKLKSPKLYYPCHDQSNNRTDFSSWSYFKNQSSKGRIVNVGSAHLWNKATVKRLSDTSYRIPEGQKKMHFVPSQLPPPRTTRAERMRQSYLISITPSLENVASSARASDGAQSPAGTLDFAIK